MLLTLTLPDKVSFFKGFQLINLSLPVNSHLSGTGTVEQPLSSSNTGRIKIHDSWWKAICTANAILPIGTKVRVLARKDLTLLVESLEAR